MLHTFENLNADFEERDSVILERSKRDASESPNDDRHQRIIRNQYHFEAKPEFHVEEHRERGRERESFRFFKDLIFFGASGPSVNL